MRLSSMGAACASTDRCLWGKRAAGDQRLPSQIFSVEIFGLGNRVPLLHASTQVELFPRIVLAALMFQLVRTRGQRSGERPCHPRPQAFLVSWLRGQGSNLRVSVLTARCLTSLATSQ